MYAYYALHQLYLTPDVLLAKPPRVRAFIYAAIDERAAEEKKRRKR